MDSAWKKLLPLLGIFALPVVLCFALARSAAGDEAAFRRGAERVDAVVLGTRTVTTWNGRDGSDVTLVDVSYTTPGGVGTRGAAEVAYGTGLETGRQVTAWVSRTDPTKLQVEAGFLNRSSQFVFFTLFGCFWLSFELMLATLLFRLRRLARRSRA